LIGISQSGQSPDIVEVIVEGRAQNRPTIAITNDRHSPLSRASEYVIELGAGVEKVVAATKTYTTSLLALALISIHLSGDESALLELQKMPSFMEKSLEAIDNNFSHVERYRYMTHCAVVGRGLNYSTAFEMSLKIKELTRVVAEPYSSADFHHGPIAMVRDGFPVIVIAPGSVLNEDMDDFCQDVLNRKGELIAISDQEQILAKAHYPIALPKDIPEWLSPMAAIVPGQLFALNLALIKNMDPDHPPGIQKITETY
jgi:glucosamine--fructose-6-phosphate aminotransferase (isomerizing)